MGVDVAGAALGAPVSVHAWSHQYRSFTVQPFMHMYCGAQSQVQSFGHGSGDRTHTPPSPFSQPCWLQPLASQSQGCRVGAAVGVAVGLAVGDVLGLAVGDTVSAHAWSVTRGPSPQLLVHM